MAHKSRRQFFEIDVRGIRTSLKDDAEEGYVFDGREIPNFSKELLQFELCVRQDFAFFFKFILY